ncbi:hypothetical protein EVAR_27868_1 [Eumeta japonica]|uniref:Uncharacterized protein n=1 Tax=Eumeta variegata TaxID=151549 RepID=A0A4C1VJB8_EUMVA|nr:hypothetical protein EVAR_27868_1 [Eumeta japonica]
MESYMPDKQVKVVTHIESSLVARIEVGNMRFEGDVFDNSATTVLVFINITKLDIANFVGEKHRALI